jgi:hypothetical protein
MNSKYPHRISVRISHSTFLALDARAGRPGMENLIRKILDDFILKELLDKQNKFTKENKVCQKSLKSNSAQL